MRVLILGGTSFVGRAIAQDMVTHGLDIALFSRGKTGTELFPQVPRLLGDRDTGDYRSLSSGNWDTVVDVSGYVPRHVGQAMDALKGRVERYLFISSQAVYARTDVAPGGDETTPRRPSVRHTEELSEETYGPLKAACEDDVRARFGTGATIVRPGRVTGPYDPSGTFTYWVRRAARGGRIALPGYAEQPVQLTDSRDLARLVVRLVLDRRSGAFDATGPATPTTLGELIAICARAAGTEAEIVPVPPESVAPMFPLVRDRSVWPTLQRDGTRARAAGMTSTPLGVTAADVLAWDRESGEPPLPRGLSPDEEAELLLSAG